MRLLVIGVLSVLAGSVHADEALVQRALGRYAAADFQGSIRLLQQASRQTTEPALLGKIHLYLGVNHEVLKEVDRAEKAFRVALTHEPTLVLDAKRFRSSALALFDRVKVSMAIPSTMPASKPVPSRLTRAAPPPASRQVALRQPVRLTRQQGPKRRGAAAVSPQDRPPQRRRIWTWVAGGCAVAAAAAAIGLGAAAVADHSEWEQVWEAGVERDRWAELERSGENKELAANVLFSVAGALAVTAVIAFFLEGRSPSTAPGKPVRF